MSTTPTNSPIVSSDLEIKIPLRNLTYQSGDTSSPRAANPNVIYPGMIVRVYPNQNRRNITVEGVRAAAAIGRTAGTDGQNKVGDFFSDLALPLHRRNAQSATGVIEAVAAAEKNDFARETSGGPQNYSAGMSTNLHILPTLAVCNDTGTNRNSAGQLVNSIQAGGEGTFTVRGLVNLTMNVGAAAATVIGLATGNHYGADTIVFLDASDNYLPKCVAFDESSSAIATQPAIASPDIIVGRLARRIDSAELTGSTIDVPVYWFGIPAGYERR